MPSTFLSVDVAETTNYRLHHQLIAQTRALIFITETKIYGYIHLECYRVVVFVDRYKEQTAVRTGWKYNNSPGVCIAVLDASRLCADARWSGEREVWGGNDQFPSCYFR